MRRHRTCVAKGNVSERRHNSERTHEHQRKKEGFSQMAYGRMNPAAIFFPYFVKQAPVESASRESYSSI